MRAFHPCSSKDTMKLSVSVSVRTQLQSVILFDWDNLLSWMLHIWHECSHTPMKNGWEKWPLFPSCSVLNLWAHCSRRVPEWAEGSGVLAWWHLSPRMALPLWCGLVGFWLSGRWQGPGCSPAAILQSNANKAPALYSGPAVRFTAGSWEASLSVLWQLCFKPPASQQC